MEINQRMSNRFAWLLGVIVLVSIGFLIACGTTYNSSTDGLVVMSSRGSGLLETFAFSLNKGSMAAVANPPNDTANLTCVLNGDPGFIAVDPAGLYAYTIITADVSNCGSSSTTVIVAFRLNSSGTMTQVGSPVTLNPTIVNLSTTVNECGIQVQEPVAVNAPVVPVQLTVDSSGKRLFIADTVTSFDSTVTYTCGGNPATTVPVTVQVPGTVSVLAVGGATAPTEITGSPYSVPTFSTQLQPANLVALAASPLVFPGPINGSPTAVCTSSPPPTAEYLYVADQANNALWQFSVDTSSAALTLVPASASIPAISSGATPAGVAGVAVDPCNRFVYASDNLANKVSAYVICNGQTTQAQACQSLEIPPGGLLPVTGSPFTLTAGANGPGPMVADPYGNYVYVLNTISNQVSILKVSPVSGTLTSLTPVATGLQPTSIAIRSDDNWLFVTNFGAATISEYAVTPQTGALSSLTPTSTDNYPFGVAVK
jgi:6-phosphogluconolactonase (cycloisomerase 2 family)